jgi:acyl carrier protein
MSVATLTEQEILLMMGEILERQGKDADLTTETTLESIGFRSLDFSELALRVEMAADATLSFDAAPLRTITTVGDVVAFLLESLRAAAA